MAVSASFSDWNVNGYLWECCNNANMTDCYEHLKWGDEQDCQAFCKVKP